MTIAPTTPQFGRDAVLVAVGLLAGALTALAIAMIASAGRIRGGEEATWLHILVLVGGMAAVIGAMAARGKGPAFPRPFDRGGPIWALAAVSAVVAAVSWRGIDWYYLTSGLVSVAIFLLVTWLLVRVNLALYFASNTLGTVVGALVLDEIGAFGAPETSLNVIRLLGVVVVAGGVVMVRAGK